MTRFICRLCRQTSMTITDVLPSKVLQLKSYVLGDMA
jgi:hypothetical protein